MKRKMKKLSLSRETLVRLEGQPLYAVRGGLSRFNCSAWCDPETEPASVSGCEYTGCYPSDTDCTACINCPY
jgi:hypothetical protein